MASLVENHVKAQQSQGNGSRASIMGKLRKLSFSGSNSGAPTIISGYLYKLKRRPQAVSLSDWNKRYFTIEGDFMYWHKTKGAERSGKVKISDIKTVKRVKNNRPSTMPPREEKNPTFLVKARERTLYLRSDRVADVDRWVRAIQLQVDLRNGGTSQGPKCEKNQKKSNGGGDKFDLLSRELDKLLENVEKVELEVNSPGKKNGAGMRKGRMGGGNAVNNNEIVIDDKADLEDDRKISAKKVSLSLGEETFRRKEGGRRTTEEASSWGGRVDFDNDKSILEPVSPRYHSPGEEDREEREGRGERRTRKSYDHTSTNKSKSSKSGKVIKGGNEGGNGGGGRDNTRGIKVRRKLVSEEKENEEENVLDQVSPPKITYVTPPKEKKSVVVGGPEAYSPAVSSSSESYSPGGYNFDKNLSPAPSPLKRGSKSPRQHKNVDERSLDHDRDHDRDRDSDRVHDRNFASPLSIETTTMSETPTPMKSGTKGKRKKSTGKKRGKAINDFGEDSIDFESSLESLEEIDAGVGSNAVAQRGTLELQEFLELDDLEELADNVRGGTNSYRLKEKRGKNRVSLVRSSNDGGVVVSNSREGGLKSSVW